MPERTGRNQYCTTTLSGPDDHSGENFSPNHAMISRIFGMYHGMILEQIMRKFDMISGENFRLIMPTISPDSCETLTE